MVPVVTRAPNITNISCWKIAPKPLVYIDPRILLNYCTLISGETIQDWIERYFSNSGIFPKFRSLFHQSVPHCLRFYLCVSASPITSKIVRFFHSFVDSCIGTICHHKDFTGRVLLWENFISPRNNLFHTQKNIFFWQGTYPQMGPICSEWHSQSDRRKSWNHRGQYWTLNPMAPKPWISHPSVG